VIELPDGFIWTRGECGQGTFSAKAGGLSFRGVNWKVPAPIRSVPLRMGLALTMASETSSCRREEGGPGASAAWAHGASRYAAIRRVATHLPHESERHASAGGATASQDDVR
jgi:hypothetical protein